MAGSDGSVEVRIVGALDPSLAASVRAANAEVGGLANTTTVSAAKMAEAIRAVGGDLSKITPAMLGVGGAATVATAEVASGAQVATVATGGLRLGTSAAIQEYIRLGHEAMQGNVSRMPGSMVVLASRMGGLTAATLGTVGAVAGLGIALLGPLAALAYLAVKEEQAEKQARALAEGFALTGRNALASAAAQEAEVDKLSQLPGVSRDAAAALIAFDASHADLNEKLALSANQLMPAFVTAFGDKATAALNTLKSKLIEISTGSVAQSIRAFEELNKTTLNLPAQSVPAIETMIRSGNGLGAALQLVLDKAEGVHVPIETLGQRISDTSRDIDAQKTKLAELQNAYAAAGTYGAAAFAQEIAITDAQITKLTGDLQLLKSVQAFSVPSGPAPLTGEDRYVAQLHVQASLAHESAEQRHIDTALIERATERLQAQGRAEHEVVTSAAQARKILGEQADETERLAAAGYREPKGPKGPNIAKQDQHIGDEAADAYREANEKRIANEEATNSFLLQMGQRSVADFVTQARDLENQRYAIEVDANQKRQQADAHDRVALAKDVAQKEVIYQEHASRMAEIDRTVIQKREQIRATDLQDFIHSEEMTLERYIKSTDAQYSAGRISAEKRAKLEQDFTADIEDAVLKRFDDENKGLVAGTEAYAKAMRDRQAIVDGFSAKVEQQEDKLLEAEAQKWKTFSSEVRSSFNGALDQLVIHGGKFRDFEIAAVEGVAQAFLHMGEKIAEDWIENQIRMMLAQDVSLAKFLSDETVKAGAVVAGQTEQVAAVAGGTTAKSTIEAVGDSKSILNSAYTAAAKAYTSIMQSVPPPLNLALAPIGAATVFGAVAAYDVISAKGGLARVAYDGQLIQAHVDEAVFPAHIARPLLNLAQSGRLDGPSGGIGGDIHFHNAPVINAPGANRHELTNALAANRSELYRFFQNEIRNGHFRKLGLRR